MLLTGKDTAHDMMGRKLYTGIKRAELYHQAAGEYCFAWGVASDDGGTQTGEFLSPGSAQESNQRFTASSHFSRTIARRAGRIYLSG